MHFFISSVSLEGKQKKSYVKLIYDFFLKRTKNTPRQNNIKSI